MSGLGLVGEISQLYIIPRAPLEKLNPWSSHMVPMENVPPPPWCPCERGVLRRAGDLNAPLCRPPPPPPPPFPACGVYVLH